MRHYSSTAVRTTLTASVTGSDTVLAVASTSGFPADVPFTLLLDGETASEEIVTVTAVSGLSLTVTRGQDGTSAVAHSAAADVRHAATARDYREPQEHIDATTGVHGVGSGSVVSTTQSQTLINKTMSGASNNFSNIPKAAIPSDTVYTTGTQTLTGKTLDGASNTFSNVPKSALPVDTVYTTTAQTLTGKTISGASNTLSNVPDSAITALAATKLTGTIDKARMPADTVYTADLPRVATGEMAYTFAGGVTLEHTISFPVGRFTSAPTLAVICRTGLSDIVAHITTAATTASVGVSVRSTAGTAITGTVYVQWIAIQEA